MKRWILGTAAASITALAANGCGSSSNSAEGTGGDGGEGASAGSAAASNGGSETGDGGDGGGGGSTSTGGSGGGGGATSSGGNGSGDGGGSGSTSTGGTSSGADGGPGGGVTGGPRFPGAGDVAGNPLQPGFGPDTADDCPPPDGIGPDDSEVVRAPATLCFYGDDKELPAATIEQVIEAVDDVEYIHLRVTFDPRFADNTYGEGSVGWGGKDGIRTFDKIVGSDHVELLLTECSGDTVMQFKVDYIANDDTAPSGYASAGVSAGDGEMIIGDEAAVLDATTSLDRNLNGCGYSEYTEDSPTTDELWSTNPDTPNWDYRVVYEVWVDASAFEECFGQAYIEFVHASPAKTSNDTITVTGEPCPPDWDTPYCAEGDSCAPPTSPPDGGSPPPPPGCPQNFTEYEPCPTECVPVPFAGYADRAPCPAGFVLDIATEGRYCVPETGEVCQ